MEYTIEFGGEPQDVTVTSSGRADVADIRRQLEALASDPRFRPGMAILADGLAVDAHELTATELREVGEAASRLGPSAWAVVVPDPVTFGLARMAQSFSAGLRLQAFYTRDEAIAWLRELKTGAAVPFDGDG